MKKYEKLEQLTCVYRVLRLTTSVMMVELVLAAAVLFSNTRQSGKSTSTHTTGDSV